MVAVLGITFGLGGCAASSTGSDAAAPRPQQGAAWSGEPYTESVPGTTVGLDLVPVPAGAVEIETPDGSREVQVGPFYMTRVEVPWDVFDVWVFALDEGSQVATGKGEEAVSRPSRPYVLPGRNFGHEGMPAQSIPPGTA